ncbi:hypothetical protein N7516_001606, partial [Penicillium verrucosum]|uniref:uncharacterized protein n=1 Tax=Penicillium verrucosum TaxID=60171 RepID=UPI0025451434
RSISDIVDLSSTTDSNTSGPNIDTTDNSDSREALNSTELITPEPTYLPNTRSRPSTRLKRPVPYLADAIEALREVTPNNKGFRDYYRRIIRTRITAEDSEEINIIITIFLSLKSLTIRRLSSALIYLYSVYFFSSKPSKSLRFPL